MNNITERASRERDQHNLGLNRSRYSRILKHCGAYSDQKKDVKSALSHAHSKTVLEIGSRAWIESLEGNGIVPKELYLINISELELEKGRKGYTQNCKIRPIFSLMDAHNLAFYDNTFDVVYGAAILHHLDLEVALQEIQRVLKPDGRIAFMEPLGINPVSKIVRLLTPNARTKDEQPFRRRELRILEKYFDCKIYPYQFLSVPIGVISGLLFKSPENKFTYLAHQFDTRLLKLFPWIGIFYRQFLLEGVNIKEGPI